MENTAIENMTLEQLKTYEEELKGQVPSDVVELNRVQDQIAQLEANQVRIQEQEEKVDSITLPYDFNELFSDDAYRNAQGLPHKVTKANEMIIELLKDYKRKDYEDHNSEIQTLTDAHKQVVSGMQQEISQLKLDKQDSDSKRDAAVREKEEFRVHAVEEIASRQAEIGNLRAEVDQLKSWNDDLRAQAAHGVRKAIDIIDISPTDKLAQMVKETTAEKANRALARWSDIIPDAVAPLSVPEVPSFLQEHNQAIDTPAEMVDTANIPVPTESPVDGGGSFRTEEVQAVPAPVVVGPSSTDGQGTVTREEFEELKGRVDHLYRVANISEVA